MRLFSFIDPSSRTHDWLLSAIVFVLCAIGFAAIYSVDLSRGGGELLIYFPKQLLAFGIGMLLFAICSRCHMALYQTSVWLFFAAAAFLLVAVLVWGESVRGTRGWFIFGPLSFQPAEFAKAALILLLGFLVARVGRRFDRVQYVLATALPTCLFAGLILLQPDFGSSAVLLFVWLGILLFTIRKKRYVVGVLAILFLGAVLSWFFFLQPYQHERLLTFIEPGRDPLGAGYNIAQSVIAVGAGRFFGRGLGFGSQSQLRFLPEAQTDFIFSVIAEELGFLGGGLVLLLYLALIVRMVFLARHCENDFGAYTILGIAWLFFIQIFLNVGAAVGMLPITGVTLPFLSYGGSSLLINFFLLGVVQSIFRSMKVSGAPVVLRT